MKRFLLLLILLFNLSNSFSQEKKQSTPPITQSELLDSINKLEVRLNQVESDFENEIGNSNKENLDLQKEINDASGIISYQNSLVNTYGQIFTILAIFIAVITLVIPVITYLFGIRPSQKALKELDQNVDRKLRDYLKNARNKEIQNALENIKNGDTEQKNRATSYLALTQHEGFTDHQLFEMYTILNKQKDENNVKSQLSFILSTRRNDYADQLFNGEDLIQDPVIKQMAYQYYGQTGYKQNYQGIIKILSLDDEQSSEYIMIAYNIKEYSSGELSDFFNDEKIISILSERTFQAIKEQLPYVLESYNIKKEYYNGTLLEEKIIATKLDPVK